MNNKRNSNGTRKQPHSQKPQLLAPHQQQFTTTSTHTMLNQHWSSRTYNDANRYDDNIRLKFLQPLKQHNHFVPRWILYITSNYLYSGGWSSFISSTFSAFSIENFSFSSYFLSFSCNYNINSFCFSFNGLSSCDQATP